MLLLSGCDSKQPGPSDSVAQAATLPPAPLPPPTQPNPAPPSTTTQQGNPRDYTTSGPLVVEQQANVSADRDGRVTAVNVDLGDRVRRGQLLATLDDRTLQADYAARTAHLESIRAQLREWQAEQHGAESDLRRSESLFQSKIISEEEVEHVRSRVEQTMAEVSRYKLDADAAESELRGAKVLLEGSRIVAPFDGVVARRSVRAAQQVKKGDELFWVTAEGPLHIVFTVPESAMQAFSRGAPLELDSAALPSLRQPAKVVKISPVVDPASGSLEVNALLEHPSPSLKPGMSMQIRLAAQ